MPYYYLSASLPLLVFGDPPPLSAAAFLERCAEHLEPAHFSVMSLLLAGEPVGHPFGEAWMDADTDIRNAAARARATRLNRDAAPMLRGQKDIRVFVRDAVAEAFAAATPLDRERALDRLRWRLLDELAGFDPFAPEAMFAYGLKLRLAEKWARLDGDAGRRALDAAVEAGARPSRQDSQPDKDQAV